MKHIKSTANGIGTAFVAGMLAFHATPSAALTLPDVPLFLSAGTPPLTLLVMGRDHKLYYEAYNDASDLDGDGTLDITYKPDVITYYGYFDSYKCYTYSAGLFSPTRATANKRCSNEWSGDFLNYLTTSRIDALRKVLYGGMRQTDSTTQTILERSHIPQDAHSWGKEYRSVAENGYLISDYAPLSLPTGTNRHFFANTTLLTGGAIGPPLLRVLQNVPAPTRIWNWVAKEQPVADGSLGTPRDYTVRVEVCRNVTGVTPEANCKVYGNPPSSVYKPTGLLHDYGETDRMMFGLLTGTYTHNTEGGVMRKLVSSFRNEVDAATGQFLLQGSGDAGIVNTIDRLMTFGFGTAGGTEYNYQPGWPGAWITTRAIRDGEQNMWGNPLAEMAYEGLRYFAGRSAPTPTFISNVAASGSPDARLGLPLVSSWTNPYSIYPRCARPFMLLMSDINPSYDTNSLPGRPAAFAPPAGDTVTPSSIADNIPGFDAAAVGQSIWDGEFGAGSRNVFIGQVGTTFDSAPTAKSASSFGNIRGLAAEEPTKQGGYYLASVAHYGRVNDINAALDDQKVNTFSVALASPIPKIDIPIGTTGTISLVPFAKSVGGCLGISSTQGAFQPTNQIVDFFVQTITPTTGVFRVNFEDVEQGADHDMDFIVQYSYQVLANNTVNVTVEPLSASGCIIQHAGYIVSGSTNDGIYLEVADIPVDPYNPSPDVDYFLDTPPSVASPGGTGWNDGGAMLPPTTSPTNRSTTRNFRPGTNPPGQFLRDPLWYAAKWGGFTDTRGENLADRDRLDKTTEWDADGNGSPDNYFLVTNPLRLQSQLDNSFKSILSRDSSFSMVLSNSTSLNINSAIFQAGFESDGWTGNINAFTLNATNGSVVTPAVWEASARLNDQLGLTTTPRPARKIFTLHSTTKDGIPFEWSSLHATQQTALNRNAAGVVDTLGSRRVDYLRGSQTDEGATFRERFVFTPPNTRIPNKLGDVVHSSPQYVGPPAARFTSSAYTTFRNTYRTRVPMLYVGANDGMLHGFNACVNISQPGCSDANLHGTEVFAYIPGAIFGKLNALADRGYRHQYYVDGTPTVRDVELGANNWRTVLVGGLRQGGRAIYALDITNPAAMTETGTDAANLVLWEFSALDDPDLGYTFSQPSIVKTRDGRWAAVFSNGYNSFEQVRDINGTPVVDTNGAAIVGSGRSALFIVFLDGPGGDRVWNLGTEYIKIVAGTSTNNGLATPAVVDLNNDYIADYVYAGDLRGDMWRFSLQGSTPATDWPASATTLFTARIGTVRQPITARPVVGHHPNAYGGVMVYFGTGKYIESGDNNPVGAGVQTYYGVWDKLTAGPTLARNDLLQQSVLGTVVASSGREFRGTTDEPISWDIGTPPPNPAHRGWYLDLPEAGEKHFTESILRDGHIIFTTATPSPDPCTFGGSGWIMELDAANGGRTSDYTFDVNGDGIIDRNDIISLGPIVNEAPQGTKIQDGLPMAPTVVGGGPTSSGTDPCKEFTFVGTSNKGLETNIRAAKCNRQRESWRQLK